MEMEYHTTTTTSITHNHRIIWKSWVCWWRSVCYAAKLKIRCFMTISSSKTWKSSEICGYYTASYIICIHITCVKVRTGWINKKCDLLLSYNLSASLYVTAVKHIWMDIRFQWFVMCNTVAVEYAYFIFWIWCRRTMDAYHNKECNVLIMRSILKKEGRNPFRLSYFCHSVENALIFSTMKNNIRTCNCNYIPTWFENDTSSHHPSTVYIFICDYHRCCWYLTCKVIKIKERFWPMACHVHLLGSFTKQVNFSHES